MTSPDAPETVPSRPADTGDDPPVDQLLFVLTGLAVVVGLIARFWPRSGLWLDESLTVNIASLPLGEIGDALRRDGHPPLYYYLLHWWVQVGDPLDDTWVRTLPAIISAAVIPLTGLAGARVASRAGAGPLGARRTALIAASTMALLPYAIRYGAESRMYSLVMVEVAVGYLLVDSLLAGRCTQRRRVATTAGLALVAGAMLWTHYWSIWLIGSVGLLSLWRLWRESDRSRRAGAAHVIGALVAGGLLFLPWVPSMLYQVRHTGTPWGEPFGIASVFVITVVDFAGARFGAAQLLSFVLIPLILLAAFVRIDDGRLVLGGLAPRVRNEVIVMVLTLTIGWLTASVGGSTFASRYSAVVLPLFALCVAAGIAVLRTPLMTNAALGVLVLLCSYGAMGEIRSDKTQTDTAVQVLDADMSARGVSDAAIVVCPDQLGVGLQRQYEQFLAERIPSGVTAYPTAGDARFVDWVDYADRNAAASPQQFAASVRSSVPDTATIYYVHNTTYKTFEGQCEQLLASLAEGRTAETLVAQSEEFDEPVYLTAIRPPMP